MDGVCNCGSVKFSVETTISGLYQCRCKLCQRQSGSTSNTAVIVPSEHFYWVSGEDTIKHWKKESGFSSHFCSNCGCPVPNRLRDTDYFWIPMGLVDECDVEIVAHICCSSKASWDKAVLEGKLYQEMPEDLSDFIDSLLKSNG